MDLTVQSWYSNLEPSIAQAFNTTAMTTLSPSEIIFGAAVAYREAQVEYNNGTSVDVGSYVNFVSPLIEDAVPALDNAGEISKSARVTLQVKTVYAPEPSIQPQQSVVII